MQRKDTGPAAEFWLWASTVARFLSFIERTDTCWLWRGHRLPTGYGQFGGKVAGSTYYAHRLAYTIYKGPVPAGDFVCHRCDNPGCVNPDHLFLGSIQDNNRDMRDKGRGHNPPRRQGVDHALARLTEEQVKEIRARYQFRRVTLKQLADEYGVHWGHISRIVRRKTWTHL